MSVEDSDSEPVEKKETFRYRALKLTLGEELKRLEKRADKSARQHYSGEILKLRKSLEQKEAEISELKNIIDHQLTPTIAKLKEQLDTEKKRINTPETTTSKLTEKDILQSPFVHRLDVYMKWAYSIYVRQYRGRKHPTRDELFIYTRSVLNDTNEKTLSQMNPEKLRHLYNERLKLMIGRDEFDIIIEYEK